MSSNDKYNRAAAKFYHSLYKTNFYATALATQRKWADAMKDIIDETGNQRNL